MVDIDDVDDESVPFEEEDVDDESDEESLDSSSSDKLPEEVVDESEPVSGGLDLPRCFFLVVLASLSRCLKANPM